MRRLFLVLAAVTLALVGLAAYKDSSTRDYLAIQQQYQADYKTTDFNVSVQQLFPAFPEAKLGDTYRTERCISCHVPDIGAIGPEEAARRLSQDFFKYEPNATSIAKTNGLASTPGHSAHPAYVVAQCDSGSGSSCVTASATKGSPPVPAISYKEFGATGDGFVPYQVLGASGAYTKDTVLAGPLPAFLNPSASANGTRWSIAEIGCIACHNGSRLALTEQDAHTCDQTPGKPSSTPINCNIIINPEYDWSQGAQLYYQYCVACHGATGGGGKGPPLSNQDRLGYYNEDYYYRCIEWGLTGFEHYGTIMPNWGSIASDYNAAAHPPGPGGAVNKSRVLTEQQISVLIQFIRHWEDYQTLP